MANLFFSFLSSLSLASGLLFVASIKTKRERRVEQLGTVVVAGVYFVVALILLYRFNDVIISILESISGVIDLGSLQAGTTRLYMLENLFLILVFALLKFLLIFVFRLVFKRWQEPLSEVLSNISSTARTMACGLSPRAWAISVGTYGPFTGRPSC